MDLSAIDGNISVVERGSSVGVGDLDLVWNVRGLFEQPAPIPDPFAGPSGQMVDWSGGLLGKGLTTGDEVRRTG
jgi:hypothetical protein